MSIIVPGSGQIPCDLMIVGEAPGENEARIGRPFVGRSGEELNWYLNRHGLSSSQFYLDNVCRLYQPKNPDPTPAQIEEWTPTLIHTIQQVKPKVILPLGRFAVRWFLGPDADMDSCHGIPHLGGEFAPSTEAHHYRARASGAILLPTYHPAYGFRQVAAKTWINIDIGKAAEIIRLVRAGRQDLIKFRRDPFEGKEKYYDVTGVEAARIIRNTRPRHIGYDTEGDPERPWSVQWSSEPGTAYVLRISQFDFMLGIQELQELATSGCVFAVHDAGTPRGTGYDTQVSRACGLELKYAKISNTMYRAFALRVEPRGLKPLLWRWCGMKQEDYPSLIGDLSRNKQIRYLEEVAKRKDWGRIPPRVEYENNGTLKLKKFGKLESRAKNIISDIAKGKSNKAGQLVDPKKRWWMLEPELRKLAETSDLGKLPFATLDDVELDKAIFYAGRDADGTGRLDPELADENIRMGVDGVCWTGNEVLPMFEEMQREGMPATRKGFVDLAVQVTKEMREIQAGLSTNWFGGQPFNPAPNTKDVEVLVRRLGITGLKKTKKSGKISTSMKSLEYLAPKYPAIREVGEWRRRQKVLHTYCLPIIEIADQQIQIDTEKLDGNNDLFLVRCKLKPVTVETRRLAAEDPSLLNQPVRTELGRKVRACYTTATVDDPDDPNQEVFGSWDFNSQEVRVAAHITRDPLLMSIMRDRNRKIHMETASRVFGKPIDQIREEDEKIPAKTAFFGMLFGLTGLGLLDLFRSFGLDTWALDDCEKLIEEIFRIYPGLKVAINRAAQEARRTGMVRDLYGHIRYLPGIWSNKKGEANEAARQAFSHWVQSTAQGQTQNAMVWCKGPIRELQRQGLKVKWTLQVHDDLILRMPRWMFPIVDRIITDGVANHHGGPTGVRFSVPVFAEGHCSTKWSQLK